MNFNFKKYIFRLLVLSFSLAVISDVAYGPSALADKYLVGLLLGQVSGLSIIFAIVLCLFWFVFNVVFTKIITLPYPCCYDECGRVQQDTEEEEE